MRQIIYMTIVAVVVCLSAAAAPTSSKVTPAARVALIQKMATHDGQKIKANATAADIRLVVVVDSRDAASTFAQIREAGGTVLSKLGRQAVISIPTNRVDDLVAITGVK